MNLDLFEGLAETEPRNQPLADGAVVLRRFALPREKEILAALRHVAAEAPFRHMITPGGYRMSVAMTNCGPLGWVSDKTGYRYQALNPDTGAPWPAMPEAFGDLAESAASMAGFPNFSPDACLVNRYEPGAKLSLHQDKDEHDFEKPIVSVSLGLPAIFLFGGLKRHEKTARIPLAHGDVVVWGGASRLRYHGVAPLKEGNHPLLGHFRVNLTFRKAA
jgi:alkylated DNA repair protein (DNA oxidative demethylase)